jgi:Secretion system C-terminal sorting domain
MKRILLILFFVFAFSTFSAKAQLAPIGTKWTYGTMSLDGTNTYFGRNVFTIERDTIFDSTTYSVIRGNTFWTNQNNKIYYYFKSQKLLFFDFNAKQGDTIYVDLLLESDYLIKNYAIRIDSIHKNPTPYDSIIDYTFTGLQNKIGNVVRYQQTISTKILFGYKYRFGNPCFSYYLLQGNNFEHINWFACYEEPNGFSYKAVVDCATVGVNEINSYEKMINVFPNPSSGIFQIEIKNILKPKTLFIYDSKGDLVEQLNLSSKLNAPSFSVQLNSNQKDGLYFLLFELESGERILKKIMLQKF